MKALIVPPVLNDITKDNSKPLTDCLINYTLSILLHKLVLMKHTFSEGLKYHASDVYHKSSGKLKRYNLICATDNTDFRIMVELPTLAKYYQHFGKDMVNINSNATSKDTVIN